MRTDPIFDALAWSLRHFYLMDKANASIHTNEVRFSPITFLVYEAFMAHYNQSLELLEDPELQNICEELEAHFGEYDLDMGR